MWELYDGLLAGLPAGKRVTACAVTPIWTIADTDCGTGLAMTPPQMYEPFPLRGKMAGMELRELAGYVKSWNFFEAAAGLAALNSCYNTLERAAGMEGVVLGGEDAGVFGGFDELLRGKKVAMIGHGPYTDYLPGICDFTVLERLPRGRDLPDPACEYLLPEQDYVFITATALENKTMKRLLELTKNCFTVIWGPSTPLCGTLLDWGADALLGHIVADPDGVRRAAGEGGLFMDFAPLTIPFMAFADPDREKYFRGLRHCRRP